MCGKANLAGDHGAVAMFTSIVSIVLSISNLSALALKALYSKTLGHKGAISGAVPKLFKAICCAVKFA